MPTVKRWLSFAGYQMLTPDLRFGLGGGAAGAFCTDAYGCASNAPASASGLSGGGGVIKGRTPTCSRRRQPSTFHHLDRIADPTR